MTQVLSFVEGDRAQAAVLVEFHRRGAGKKPDVVFPIAKSIHRYQFEPESYDPSAKASMVAFMSPIIHECYAPDLTAANERRCIAGRVTEVKAGKMEISPFLGQTMLSFVEQFLPPSRFQVLDPTDDDELYARQNRPAQRRILQESSVMIASEQSRIVKMFQKKEPYAEPKDPRPISTITGVDKGNYSKFIYPLSDYIKTQHWYAFGLNPIQIALRVAQVVASAQMAVNTDLSRFDGRVSAILRELEKLVLVCAFRP
jgi:hypothetical protein